tara:strand:- start:4755 stop:5678 length:924 start_codon:yes stop_codon:yes gene_type:complete
MSDTQTVKLVQVTIDPQTPVMQIPNVSTVITDKDTQDNENNTNLNNINDVNNVNDVNDVKDNKSKLKSKSNTVKPPSYGVVYLAFGLSYLKEAVKSARSFKKFHPRIPISIWTDNVAQASKYTKLFHKIHLVKSKPVRENGFKVAAYAKLHKIKAMAASPYDITLYLDCDTKVRSQIGDLFKIANNYDIVIANSPKLDKTVKPFRLVSYRRPKAYNSGMIVYRKNEITDKLFKHWLKDAKADPKIYVNNRDKFFDQPKLVKLLNKPFPAEIKMKVVPNIIYNARHTMISKLKRDKLWNNVKIVHQHT